MFLWFDFPFWTFLSCFGNFFLKLHLLVCLWVSVCEYGHAMMPVWRQDSLWDSVVSFLHVGHQAYPSHRPAVISLVPPVLGKLPFWAANDHASYSVSFSLHLYLFPSTCLTIQLQCSFLSQVDQCPCAHSFADAVLWAQCCFLSSHDCYLFRSKTGVLMQPSGTPGRNLDLSSLVALGDALWSFLG